MVPSMGPALTTSLALAQAATGAGMRCVITYTTGTASQDFAGAERIVGSLGDDPPEVTLDSLRRADCVQDDRVEMRVSETGAVTF